MNGSQLKPSNIKNGKIELLRFFFCISVLLFHECKYLLGEPSLKHGIHFAFFPHGSIGVEFFFVLSGFLMAKSAFSKLHSPSVPSSGSSERQDLTTPSRDYLSFLAHKYTSIFPQHIVAFFIAFFVYVVFSRFGILSAVKCFLDSIPNILLIQMSGISLSNPNHVEWYLSCMLIAMAILYPLCRRYYYTFTRCLAPLSALLILGYLCYTTASLTGVSTWMGLCYKSLLRAIAEIALGTTAFEFSRYLASRSFSKGQRLLLTLAEFALVLFSALFILLTLSKQYEVYILAAVVLLISLCFSNVTYGTKGFNNPFVYYLGKLTLPIYLGQISAIRLVQHFLPGSSHRIQIVAAFLLALLLAQMILLAAKALTTGFAKMRSHN